MKKDDCRINGYTRTCGLIGNPVEHTLSPLIHNTLAGQMKENLVYVPLHVQAGNVKEAVEGAWALNLLGINVTVPYKSEVIPYLKEIDPLATGIGAVNTLVRSGSGFKGYNTDMPGLLRAMTYDGVRIAGENFIILGAGGAARAVAVLLASQKAAQIYLLNRTPEKAQAVAEEVNRITGRRIVEGMMLTEYDRLPGRTKYTAIQASSVGMFPDVDTVILEDPAFYRMLHTGYDLIFNPGITKFMRLTMEQGGNAFNGVRMLLYQGVIAYELWTGTEVPEALSLKIYEKLKEAMGI